MLGENLMQVVIGEVEGKIGDVDCGSAGRKLAHVAQVSTMGQWQLRSLFENNLCFLLQSSSLK